MIFIIVIVIYLGIVLPLSSSNLPVSQSARTTPWNLFNLAPNGVYKLSMF